MRFRNLDETVSFRSPVHVLRWKLGLGPEPKRRSPARAEVPFVKNDGVALRGAGRDALTWIGHATYLVQLGGRTVITDPILSPRVAIVPRNAPPGLTHDTLPRIDVVTVSHNHFDHMDLPTLARLARVAEPPAIVVPTGLAAPMRKVGYRDVFELGWWETAEVRDLAVTLVPAQHWSRRGLTDTDETLWGGFVIEGGGLRAYHSGDTAYFSGFAEIGRRVGPIDAAMLPIGAYDPRWFMRAQHMNPEDAVQAFVDLGAKRFFAMHWGTFKLTDEPLGEPPTFTRDVWTQRGLDEAALEIPAIGETVRL
jgi:L-ascorbate metabolism protein UlaG (beta-lactamase superfamily)